MNLIVSKKGPNNASFCKRFYCNNLPRTDDDISKIVEVLVHDKFSDKVNKYWQKKLEKSGSIYSTSSSLLSTTPTPSSSSSIDDNIHESSTTSNYYNSSKSISSTDDDDRQTSSSDENISAVIDNIFESIDKLSGTSGRTQSCYAFRSTRTVADDHSSIDTCNISSLISKQSSSWFCNSGTMNPFPIRDTSLSDIQTDSTADITNCINEVTVSSNHMNLIWHEITVQNSIISQISKAIEYCKRTRFAFSPQHVEAEKILLVAEYKKYLLTEKIDGKSTINVPSDASVVASVAVKNLTLSPKILQHLPHRNCDKYQQFYLCLIDCNNHLEVSEIAKEDDNGIVGFKAQFNFTQLHSGFRLNVAIYSLKISNNLAKEKSSKKSGKSKNFTKSDANFLSHNDSTNSPFSSLFTLFGSATITISHLATAGEDCTFEIEHAPFDSRLAVITANLDKHVAISESKHGFLTISRLLTGSCPLWNRRWCHLDGHLLKYYNYPCEENVREPLHVIDLATCVGREIGAARRDLCARSKTIFIEVLTRINGPEKYLLAADKLDEYTSWLNSFNLVLSNLIEWNCLQTNNMMSGR